MMSLQKKLLFWYNDNRRDFPWRKSKDPYKVWLSEIILQQTRAAQGLPYFLKFENAFPTVQSLAEAEEEEVLKLWQGLGYYSRARNLHFTAQTIVNEFNGIFPNDFKKLKSLKGIGETFTECYQEYLHYQSQLILLLHIKCLKTRRIY
jgi:A/G-specific adenine glycosylase